MANPAQSGGSLAGLIGKIEALTGDVTATAKSTVDRDIVNPSGKVTARLTGAEKMRLRKETRIFWDEYYKIRGRYEKDEKGKTQVRGRGVGGKAAAVAAATKQGLMKKAGFPWLAALLGFAFLKKFLTSLAKNLWRAITGPLKAGWKALKGILKSGWKALKGFLKAGWKGLKAAWKAGLKAIKGIWKGMSKAVKGGFSALKKGWNKAWKGIKNSKAWKGLTKALSKGVSAIKGIFQSLGSKIKSALKSIGSFIKGTVSKIPGGKALMKGMGALGKGVVSAAKGGKSLLGKAWGGLKSMGKAAWGGAKAVGRGAAAVGKAAWKGVKTVAGMPLKAAKAAVGSALGKAIGRGGKNIVGFLGRAVGHVGKRIPIIGPAIEAMFAHHEIRAMRDKHQTDPQKYTEDQLHQDAGARGISGITAMVGAGAGGFLGALAGSVVPVVGNIIGGIVGAIGGDLVGRWVGSLLTDHVIPKSATKDIGKWIIGNTPMGKGGGIVPGMGGANPFYSGPQAGTGQTVGGAAQAVGGAVGGAVGKTRKMVGLAKGGIVTRPTLALIGEAGPEAVVPLGGGDNEGLVLLRQIRTGINKLVKMGGGGGGVGPGEAAAIAAQAAQVGAMAAIGNATNLAGRPDIASPGGSKTSGRATYHDSPLSLNVPPYYGN